ncbi:DUF4198 domain-containing protein [soil metagenome]
MRAFRNAALTSLLMAMTAGSALAHSPYVRPNVMDATGRDHVTVEASFTEDIFASEIVMRSDHWHVVGPNGDTPITAVTYLRDLAVFEAATPVDGTYRISSGPRIGRTGQMYQAADGSWKMVGEEDGPAPAGATLVPVQSITTADVYVTRGVPSATALTPSGHGLEVVPLIQPGDVVAGEDLPLQLLFDGKPLADTPVTVFREAGLYDGKKIEAELTSDAEGKVLVRVASPGAYMTLVRHRTDAPDRAEVAHRSYSHTLTFAAQGD